MRYLVKVVGQDGHVVAWIGRPDRGLVHVGEQIDEERLRPIFEVVHRLHGEHVAHAVEVELALEREIGEVA